MTTAPATQALLPDDTTIAAAARQALGEWLAWPDAGRDGPREVTNEQVNSWLSGLPNKLASLTNEAARHRQAHSLPGDVGMREALEKIAADFGDFPLPEHKEKLGDWSWHSMAVEQQSIALAALTPSALSGDAGEGPDWIYDIQWGPEGQQDYAYVFDRGGNMIAVMKTHDAALVAKHRAALPSHKGAGG